MERMSIGLGASSDIDREIPKCGIRASQFDVALKSKTIGLAHNSQSTQAFDIRIERNRRDLLGWGVFTRNSLDSRSPVASMLATRYLDEVDCKV